MGVKAVLSCYWGRGLSDEGGACGVEMWPVISAMSGCMWEWWEYLGRGLRLLEGGATHLQHQFAVLSSHKDHLPRQPVARPGAAHQEPWCHAHLGGHTHRSPGILQGCARTNPKITHSRRIPRLTSQTSKTSGPRKHQLQTVLTLSTQDPLQAEWK